MDKLLVSLLELKLADDKESVGEFEGYGSTFGNVDNGKDRCVRGCFTKSVKSMTDGETQKPLMLWMHDQKEPIGEWKMIREDEKGLYVKGQLWLGRGIQRAEQAHALLQAKSGGLSIGYITKKSDIDRKTSVRDLIELDVKELSVVTVPMNSNARVIRVKSDLTTLDEIEALTSIQQLLVEAKTDARIRELHRKMSCDVKPIRGTNGTFKSIDQWLRTGGKGNSVNIR